MRKWIWVNFRCRSLKYAATLPAVSIIIIFNNEHLNSLLRTCVSIFNRSPTRLMNEIILVDDTSNFEELGKPLDDFVERNAAKIKLIRLKTRTGLIRARLIGARRAKSEVLLFLDAHCEVNTNWLPPLLGKNESTHSLALAVPYSRFEPISRAKIQ